MKVRQMFNLPKGAGKMKHVTEMLELNGVPYVVATKENTQEILKALIPPIIVWDEVCKMPYFIEKREKDGRTTN